MAWELIVRGVVVMQSETVPLNVTARISSVPACRYRRYYGLYRVPICCQLLFPSQNIFSVYKKVRNGPRVIPTYRWIRVILNPGSPETKHHNYVQVGLQYHLALLWCSVSTSPMLAQDLSLFLLCFFAVLVRLMSAESALSHINHGV